MLHVSTDKEGLGTGLIPLRSSLVHYTGLVVIKSNPGRWRLRSVSTGGHEEHEEDGEERADSEDRHDLASRVAGQGEAGADGQR